jgi:hypothetical protein
VSAHNVAALTDEERETLKAGGIVDDLSTQGASEGRRLAEQAQGASHRLAPGTVAFPNGRIVRVEDLDIDHEYLAGNYTSIFADTAKYLKNPLPGAMYVWAKKDDPNALAKVRSHLYRRVELDELVDDCDLPVSMLEGQESTTTAPQKPNTHPTAGKKNYVVMYDVQLMEVRPEAVKRLYGLPAIQAKAKMLANMPLQQLKGQVEDLTGKRATVEYDSKVVHRPVGE